MRNKILINIVAFGFLNFLIMIYVVYQWNTETKDALNIKYEGKVVAYRDGTRNSWFMALTNGDSFYTTSFENIELFDSIVKPIGSNFFFQYRFDSQEQKYLFLDTVKYYYLKTFGTYEKNYPQEGIVRAK